MKVSTAPVVSLLLCLWRLWIPRLRKTLRETPKISVKAAFSCFSTAPSGISFPQGKLKFSGSRSRIRRSPVFYRRRGGKSTLFRSFPPALPSFSERFSKSHTPEKSSCQAADRSFPHFPQELLLRLLFNIFILFFLFYQESRAIPKARAAASPLCRLTPFNRKAVFQKPNGITDENYF